MEAIKRGAASVKTPWPNMSPDQYITNHFQKNAPLGRGRSDYFLLPSRPFARHQKCERPRDPAEDEFDEGDSLEHPLNCICERFPVSVWRADRLTLDGCDRTWLPSSPTSAVMDARLPS